MKLNVIGSNMTEIKIGANNQEVLFSYNTPVAYFDGVSYYKTSKKWSKTTSKHINKWLDGVTATEKEQSFFDNLI